MAQHGGLHGAENSGEPNDRNPQENSVDDLPGHHHFGPAPPDGGVDESRVCLLDTACTACMHYRRWRLAYEKTLPSGMVCSATSATKTFFILPMALRLSSVPWSGRFLFFSKAMLVKFIQQRLKMRLVQPRCF